MSNRFRRLTDLFTVGQAVPLDDGSYIWVQALNSYQRDECISDAQVARARLVMALRVKGDEKTKVEAQYYEQGRERLTDDLATSRSQAKVGRYLDDMRSDPEWKERMAIVMRTDPEDGSTPLTLEEVDLLASLNEEVMTELRKREVDEKDFQIQTLTKLTDEEVIEEWTEEWLDRRGTTLATAEFQLTELWYASRYCAAPRNPDTDVLDHSQCDGHAEKIFETRQDVRSAPNALIALLATSLASLNVEGSDPKGSASAASSSDSSPTPSEAEESTPSTSSETPSAPPGT